MSIVRLKKQEFSVPELLELFLAEKRLNSISPRTIRDCGFRSGDIDIARRRGHASRKNHAYFTKSPGNMARGDGTIPPLEDRAGMRTKNDSMVRRDRGNLLQLVPHGVEPRM